MCVCACVCVCLRGVYGEEGVRVCIYCECVYNTMYSGTCL